jgi:hypothetical protein
MKFTFQPGDRVRVPSPWSGRGVTGALVRRRSVLGMKGWIVHWDKRAWTGRKEGFVNENVLRPESRQDPGWLSPGKRAVIYAIGMKGRAGSLVRPTRLWWNGKRGWLVQLDKPFMGFKRVRVVEWGLVPPEASDPHG